MVKYLITGVSGFVAQHFLEYLDSLDKTDIDVLGISRQISDTIIKQQFKNLKLRFEALNLLEYHLLERLMVSFSPDYIVHLASFSSVSMSWNEPVASFMNNTNIFLNICEVIRKNNIRCRLLSVGSSEEYGNVPANCIPINETIQLNPVSPYAIARVSQEMLSRCYVSSYKLDIILTRSFNHIGARQRDIFVIPSFVKQLLNDIKNNKSNIILHTGDISIIRDFIDVRDVVRSYYLLLQKGLSGELYNVCTGIGHSLQEVIDMLARLLHIDVITKTDYDRVRPNDNRIIIGDNNKIKSHTGWQNEITLLQSLDDLIVYWKNELGI
jgi:GDP-4-dehydro-6-deoxy-D-mannose reductase